MDELGLDREALIGLYRSMLVTRRLEETGHTLYKQGKIPGSFYTGRGNEAASVAVAAAMGPDDVGVPLHRNLGVHVHRSTEPWRILANYLGRPTGLRAAVTGTSTSPTSTAARSPSSATCRRCSRSSSGGPSRSGSGTSRVWRSAGSATAPRRRAIVTRR